MRMAAFLIEIDKDAIIDDFPFWQYGTIKNILKYLLKGGAVLGKQVLLINDLPGYGEVALAAMMPILTHMGHHIYNLPTALVSNTLDYGKFEILDTTDYMIHTLDVWRALNFSFDAVSTGFIVTEKQAEMIREYCVEERKKEH